MRSGVKRFDPGILHFGHRPVSIGTLTLGRPQGRYAVQMFEPSIGGVPAYVLALAAALVSRGWRIDVIHSENDGIRAAVERAGARSIAIPMRHGPGPHDLVALRATWKQLRASKPALLHAHSTKAGLLGAVAGRLARVPTVYTPHSWAFERRDIGRAPRAVYAGMERVLARGFHRSIITVSGDEARAARGRRISPQGGVHVVRTGLPSVDMPLRRSAREQLGIGQDEVVAVWVGRNAPQKRPEDLAPLSESLAGTVRIAALGQGLAGSSEGDALIASGGMIIPSGTDPQVVYAAGDLFVQTSAWEGLSLAVLEAMAAGLPVLAYAVGGLAEQVEDGVTGQLFEVGHVSSLADAVARIAADAEKRRTLGQGSRRRLETHFGFIAMVEAIEARYAALVSR